MPEQVGIPLFYLQELAGAQLRFKDLFNDASIFWGWEQDKGEVAQVQKTIQEISGQMRLGCNSGYPAYWDNGQNEAPKVFIGILSRPCEVITRLDYFSAADETIAGLFISKAPSGFGAANHISIGRCRKDSIALNGLAVTRNSYDILASNAITTLPVWLRMRISADSYQAGHVWLDYSLNGVNWVNMYEWHGQVLSRFGEPGASVGLYCANGINSIDGGSMNETAGWFDHFIMKPKSVN